MGWPKETVTPGIVATARRISASSSSLGRPDSQHNLQFRAIYSLDMLVSLGAPRSATRRYGLRKAQECFFDGPTERITLFQTDTGSSHDANSQ